MTVDAWGNTSPYVYGRAIEPYDDVGVPHTGPWQARRSTSADWWLGTAHVDWATGATMRMTLTGTQLFVIGDRGSRYGTFRVYVNGNNTATVDTSAGTRWAREVLWKSPTYRNATRVLKIVKTGSAKVVIDASDVTSSLGDAHGA